MIKNCLKQGIFLLTFSSLCFSFEAAAASDTDLADKAVRLREFDKAFQLYRSDAIAGHAEAQYQLAKLLLLGIGTDKNEAMAQQWFEKAADQEHAAAQFNLAILIRQSNPSLYRQLLQSSAKKGYALAKSQLETPEQQREVQPDAFDLNALFFAAKKNNIAQLQAIRDAGENILAVDKNQRSALYTATEAKAEQAVVWLLEQGLAPGASDSFGVSPLSKAIELDATDIFSHLLRKHQGSFPVLPNGDTLLHQAIHKNNFPITSSLTKKIDDINALNKDGWTALDLALYYKQSNIASLLKQHNAKTGASWNKKIQRDVRRVAQQLNQKSSGNRLSPAEEAILSNNHPLLQQVLVGYSADNINHPQKTGYTLLAMAVQQGSSVMVKTLVDSGGNPNIAGDFGITPLMSAAKRGELESAKILLSGGALVITKDEKERDAIDHAIQEKNPALALLLINHLEKNRQAYPAKDYLLLASKQGEANVVKRVIRNKEKLNKYDSSGRNALWFACKANQPDLIVDLVNAGIHPDAIDNNSQSLLSVSASSNCLSCAKNLLQFNDINHQTVDGSSVLMIAAQHSDANFTRWLLQQKIKKELRDNQGNTALIHAVKSNAEDIVKVLIEADVNITRKNRLGLSAMDIAKESSPELYEILKKSTAYNFF